MTGARTLLKLGRVSNLPTVWSNALAGIVLAGAVISDQGSGQTYGLATVILSLFYVAGMWLNDAFDAGIDARERANRPIPLGEISRSTVFAVGGGMLGIATALGFVLGTAAGAAGVALAAMIVFYDWIHKRTALSPLAMGACRFLSYGVAALAVAGFSAPVLVGAAGLFCYVVGVTYAARQEAYDRLERAWPLGVLAIPLVYAGWQSAGGAVALALFAGFAACQMWSLRLLFRRREGDVSRAVVMLIAGISLYDAVLIAAYGSPVLAGMAVLCFAATLMLQRLAPGT